MSATVGWFSSALILLTPTLSPYETLARSGGPGPPPGLHWGMTGHQLLNELKCCGKRGLGLCPECLCPANIVPFPRAYGVVSMCIGTGMGAATVFEYPVN
ncbi:Hypothetical predicted protein [Marmota monax]|uniref:Uncharacterized protein n=1 Tax=Marmota monax TaxID=9995 RepID=A0A5E4CM31_MARMO|nr:hypothetical protein GHT09_018469 [Marmota monax]VTJ82400.1 Hypothetical predicted protein [Marmota monax]